MTFGFIKKNMFWFQDLEKTGFIGPQLTCDYACKVVAPEDRAACRVLDIGAGTGLVAKYVNIVTQLIHLVKTKPKIHTPQGRAINKE